MSGKDSYDKLGMQYLLEKKKKRKYITHFLGVLSVSKQHNS